MDDGAGQWRSNLRRKIALAPSLVDRVRVAVSRSVGLPRNPGWRRVLETTDNRSMVDRLRRVNLLRLLSRVDRESVPGSLVECGVARGGTAALMGIQTRDSALNRDLWLFDSFVGLPEPTRDDGLAARRFAHGKAGGQLTPIGQCVGTVEDVRAFLFGECQLAEARVRLVQGWFQDTLPAYDGGPIALVHVDGDWYESVRVCLESLWPSVSRGGYVVVDDYGHWEGARRATREFITKQPGDISLRRKGYSQAYFRKQA